MPNAPAPLPFFLGWGVTQVSPAMGDVTLVPTHFTYPKDSNTLVGDGSVIRLAVLVMESFVSVWGS